MLFFSRKSLPTTVDDTNFAVLPFYHIYGLMPILFGAIQHGGCLVSAQAFDPAGFLNAINTHEVYYFFNFLEARYLVRQS